MRLPWRAGRSVDQSMAILKPYRFDALSRRMTASRRWLFISVVLFCFFYGFIYAFLAPFLLIFLFVPIAILLALAIWALPDSKTTPTRTLEYLFYAFLISLIMWPNYLAIAIPGLPWITLIRLTGFPLIFILLICISTSSDFRNILSTLYKNTPILPASLALFVAIQFFSIALSKQKMDSIQKFFIDQVYWTGIFVISSYVFLNPGRISIWSKLMWIMIWPIGIIGIVEARFHHVIWAGHIPSFLKIEDKNIQMLLAGIFRAYTNIYRVQSTFSTSLGLSEYLALTIPFVIYYAIGQHPRLTRILAFISIPFILYVILISGSRLGVLGFGLSGMIYLLVWGILKWRRERGGIVGPAIVLSYPAVFSTLLAASFFIGTIRKIVWGGGAAQGSTDARMTQLKMGIPMILRNPFGYGIGQGAETLGYYTPGGILTIDTYYLLIALDYGVIGFIVYYGMLSLFIFYAGKQALGSKTEDTELSFIVPAFIALVNFLVIKSAFSQTDNHPLVFMIMGMVVALCFRANREQAETGRQRASG